MNAHVVRSKRELDKRVANSAMKPTKCPGEFHVLSINVYHKLSLVAFPSSTRSTEV